MIHCIAESTIDAVPCPVQSTTRPARSEAFLATPYPEPAAMAETWVPWPWQSSAFP